tara:strand:+ start:488 stop:724 length:237 start_codon:yes stop_codon:yes gene_type:complete
MKAVLWSKDNCQWCDRVKQLFNATNISITEYKFGEHFDKKAFYEEFGEGATFPQVQIDTKHIGGCKETLQYLQRKKLI